MSLASGSRLGPYEILSALGSGGMGEVYRARDRKLDRDVAIKVLPEELAANPERIARFEREAKTLAALNHPGIAHIHGVEDSTGTPALVMELVEGPTLADRLKKGPLPLDEALAIAKQIAEALEAAHEQGIIHRDLKPANIKVREDGTVKILDFGLAKALDPVVSAALGSSGPSNLLTQSPTLATPAMVTGIGVILGTAAYMSPEQAKGRSADKRSDIWAFGCVLYEMLTGKRAFPGEDVTEILAAVVRAEPDWRELPAPTPPNVRHLLRRCLHKDRRFRLRDAGDVGIEIQEALASPAEDPTTRAAEWKRAVPLRVASVLVILIAVIAAIATWNLKPVPASAPRPVTRTVINLPPGDALAWDQPALAVSSDGSRVAYVAVRGGTQQIYLRALNSFDSTPVAGTEGGHTPFFSPDGQWLGFFAEGRLKKVPVNGGPVLTLANALAPRGATWGPGTIIFSALAVGTAAQVSDAGGTPQPVTHLEKGDTGHRWTEFLPNGAAVLFAAGTTPQPRLGILTLGTGEQRALNVNGGYPRYARSGHLVYALDRTLMAAPFDLQRRAITGAAVPVVQPVQRSASTGAVQYAISSSGSLVYVRGAQAEQRRLVWVDRTGREEPLPAPVRGYETAAPRLSPDGRRFAVGIDFQIWLSDIARETPTRFTYEGAANLYPVWAPDSQRIAFASINDGVANIYWQRADGSGGRERLTNRELTQYPQSFSPDGQWLAYTEFDPTWSADIWVLRMSDRKAQPFLTTPFIEGAPQFSPDGHWLAYISNESGRFEVYVQAYPGPGGKHQVSADGGTEPMWNPKGSELFYRDGDRMMAVDITTQPAFSAAKPRILFERHYVPTTGTVPFYSVTADGQRFVFVKDYEKSTPITQISVVENWFTELKQRVPTK